MTSSSVVVATWTGEGASLPGGTEEALALGRKLGGLLGASLRWLVVGPLPSRAAELAGASGVVAVDHVDDAALREGGPDLHVEALSQYCAARAPAALLFPQTDAARLVAARLAGRLGGDVVMNGVDLEVEGGRLRVVASAYGGDTRAVYELSDATPHVIGLTPTAVEAPPAESATSPAIEKVQVDLAATRERMRVVSRSRSEGPRLEDARIIVAGGRGLGSADKFALVEELAAALGGMAGASRPIVDDGWAPPARQVGLTGKITRPALYVAVGISGASQHMAGCAAAKTIVAINRDPDAAIFRYARYGIAGNCLEVLPELIRAVRERRAAKAVQT